MEQPRFKFMQHRFAPTENPLINNVLIKEKNKSLHLSLPAKVAINLFFELHGEAKGGGGTDVKEHRLFMGGGGV